MFMDFAHRALASPTIYNAYQSLIGAPKCHAHFIQNIVRPRSGDRILDVGCGVGSSIKYLPANIAYVGIDISEAYVAKARATYGDRGEFICADVRQLNAEALGKFDRAFSFGVLHHLSDKSARIVVGLMGRVIKPGGTFVTIDPCYQPGQHPLARFLANHDRGKFIRDSVGFKTIVNSLGSVRVTIYHDLLRIPFTQIVMEVDVAL
jgi:SAM-dependent methyltransferase